MPQKLSRKQLSAVLHDAVKESPCGAQMVAAGIGKPYATLMSELSSQPGHKLGANLVLPLMRAAETTAPLQFLAREMGGVFVPIQPAVDTTDLMDTLVVSIKEFGEFAAECAADIRDGTITLAECERMLSEAQEALCVIAAMMDMVKKVHAKQYGGGQ